LAANGLLSGTVTGVDDDTTYNFTIVATDQENQDSSKSFSVFLSARDEYFKYTTLLLSGDGTNGAQNNTFLDGSTNNFTITRNGNTTQGTFSPFSGPNGYWSNYFDGSGDYLEFPASSAFNFGTNNFTIDCWFYITGNSALNNSNARDAVLFSNDDDISGAVVDGSVGLQINGNSTTTGTGILFYRRQTSGAYAEEFFYGGTISQNEWHHVAVTKNGSTVKIFLDGTEVLSTTATNTTFGTSSKVNTIGDRRIVNYRNDFNGYIASMRVVNGTAITPPSGGPTSPPSASTSNQQLLTCYSNRFVDSNTNVTAKSITVYGTPKVTPFSPFAPSAAYDPAVNGGSGYFDGTGDYLSGIGTTSSFNFLHNSSAKFTFQAWIYLTASGSSYVLIDTAGNSGSNVGLVLNINSSNQIGLVITRGVSGNFVFTGNSTGAVTPFAWNHVAVTYDQSLGSSNAVFYINGVQSGTGNKTANAPSSNNATYALACAGSATGGQVFSGYITGLQISNSVDSITVPTAPLAPAASTNLLLNFTNAGIFDNTGKNNLETVGNAQIDTGTKKYGTGSMEFDGTGDYLISNSSTTDLYAFGNGDWTIECWVYFNTTTGAGMIYDSRGPEGFYPTIYRDGTTVKFYTNSVDRITSGTITTGTWYYLAVARSGTSTKMFIDGTQAGSTYSDSNVYLNAAQRPYIGAAGVTGFVGTVGFNGFIDDLRITKGIARYTANFTAPTKSHKLK
jgi:hypothetical protein